MSSTPPSKKQQPGILARQRDGDQALHPESCSAPEILLDELQTVSHNGTEYSGITMTENLRTERPKKANRIAVTAKPFAPRALDELLSRGVIVASEEPHRYWEVPSFTECARGGR
jgi:hypothetical protein